MLLAISNEAYGIFANEKIEISLEFMCPRYY